MGNTESSAGHAYASSACCKSSGSDTLRGEFSCLQHGMHFRRFHVLDQNAQSIQSELRAAKFGSNSSELEPVDPSGLFAIAIADHVREELRPLVDSWEEVEDHLTYFFRESRGEQYLLHEVKYIWSEVLTRRHEEINRSLTEHTARSSPRSSADDGGDGGATKLRTLEELDQELEELDQEKTNRRGKYRSKHRSRERTKCRDR